VHERAQVRDIELSTTVVATANYAYLPFEVPPGIARLDVSLTRDRQARVGIGLFDPRGHGFQSPGFRGIAGRERTDFFLAADDATPGFTPGPIDPGTWTVIIPVFLAVLPARVTVRVRMTSGPAAAPALPGPLPGVVRPAPGWYRGDLHCHTEASSDAWATGSSLTPAGWADLARARGMHFLAMTDHNVISQNHALARDSGDGILLLAGEEVTNYFHGHTTVSGIEPGQWLDFRHTPFGLPLPTGGRRVRELVRVAHELGGFVAAAHPLTATMAWHFLADAAFDEAARPDGFEVWNGPWQVHEEAALRVWEQMLRHGWDVAANGGSDLHGTINRAGRGVGVPTTVVYASALAREPIVAALRAGRSFITRAHDGVEIYLTAGGPGGQETFTGGRIHGATGEVVTVRALVRRGGGMRLRLITADGEALQTALEGDEQTVEWTTAIGRGDSYVRAEVRGEPRTRGPLPVPHLDMEALTNPIRLVVGEPPAEVTPQFAPPPSTRP